MKQDKVPYETTDEVRKAIRHNFMWREFYTRETCSALILKNFNVPLRWKNANINAPEGRQRITEPSAYFQYFIKYLNVVKNMIKRPTRLEPT